jgi:hypothetical protein
MLSVDSLFTVLFYAAIVYGAALHYRYWSLDNSGVSLKLRYRKIIFVGLGSASVVAWFILAHIYRYCCRTRSKIANAALGRS